MRRTIITAMLVILTLSLALPSIGLGQSQVDYSDLDRVLKRCVTGKFVDYHSLVEDHAELDLYIGYIRRLPRARVDGMTENERLAFWINTFNALTLKSIIDAWPVMSIKRIDGFREKLWTVAGKPTTLDNIRMKYLGYDIGDPRAYLATCDGTAGSPPLKPYVFTPDKIQEQLDKVAREAVNDPEFTVFQAERHTLEVNNNLYWFREFFVKKYPDQGRFKDLRPEQAAIINFIEEYAEGLLKAELQASDKWVVGTNNYGWMLNSNKRPPVPMNPDAQKKPTQ